MMKAAILSLLLGAASVAARSRGGGGGGNGVTDNWDAPPLVKATLAFYVIFMLITLVQLASLIKNLKLIPTMQARAPYIMLTILTVILALAFIGAIAYERILYTADVKVLDGVGAWFSLFLDIDDAFRPAVIFYIAHQRAKILRASRGKGFSPLAGKFWKRCLDWVLAAFICLFLITNLALTEDENRRIENDYNFDLATYYTYYHVRSGFGHTVIGFLCLLAISIGVGLITLHIQGKRAQFIDPIITRLLVAAYPFFVVFTLEWFIVEIYVYVAQGQGKIIDSNALNFAEVLIDGICRLGMGFAIISTMTIQNVQWSLEGGNMAGQYPNATYPPSYHTAPHQQGWHSSTPPWSAQQPQQQPLVAPPAGQPQPPYSQPGVAQV